MNSVKIEYANRDDIKEIINLIKALADYENLSSEAKATEELLEEWIFDKKKAEVILLKVDEEIAGFALFFYNFSTFLGRAGIYIEDLFIYQEYRGKGLGKLLFRELSKIALERECGRLEWSCLDWNSPSIEFYKSHGAKAMAEWTNYRLTEEDMKKITG